MYLVIAKNYQQFKNSKFNTSSFKYIGGISKLYGYSNTKMYLIGEYWLNNAYKHPDFKNYCIQHNIKIKSQTLKR